MNTVLRAVRNAAFLSLLAASATSQVVAASQATKPMHLTSDSLVQPIGLDTEHPQFSWQLQDPSFGARQTAYLLQVATTPSLLAKGKPDIWDSGQVTSDRSVGVAYSGPALLPEKRYYWQVKVWDKSGKPYPTSDPTWLETGLMTAQNWTGKWIGYEQDEELRIRQSGAAWITNPGLDTYTGSHVTRHDFRFQFGLSQPVKRAVLYVTGRDTAAAWINGQQVVQPLPVPGWKGFPWQTYTQQEVTSTLRSGKNLLAVEVTLNPESPNETGTPSDTLTPMSACLYLEMADGSIALFKSGTDWKSALNSDGTWQLPEFNDSGWKEAIPYAVAGSTVGSPWPTGAVKLLRRGFNISSPIASARLYVTALGAYQMQINGKRVGDQILAPGWMDFREHVPYQAYDVTSLVTKGANAIGAYLAPGWYTTPLIGAGQGHNYGNTPPALKAQLRIEHKDGAIEWIATDNTWQASVSPILKAEIYDGEFYDSRREQPGWDTASFPANGWKPVEMIHPLEPTIVPQYFPPVRIEKTLDAKAITNPKPGVYIYDFDQNLAGVVRLSAQGPAGTDVQLRFGEVLNPDGSLYTENLRTAKATDHFILSGKGVEHYQPTFTFHGFRYVEVTGLPAAPGITALQAVVFHTDAPFTAKLQTGSPMINQLWENILWGQRSNFISVPTDCPQRDERLGWSADAQVFWRTASYNMDLTQFSKKYAADLRGTQVGTPMYGIYAPGTITPNPGFGAGWSDAGVIIPWTAWLQSGDTRVIEENWSAMEKYLNAIQADSPDYLWKNSGIPFGDWLSPEGPTKELLVATAYWAYDVTLMQQMAHALGRTADERKYEELFSKIKGAFQKEFVHPDGLVVGANLGESPFGEPKPKSVDTQTGYVLALQMKLLPDSLRQTAAARLVAKIVANHGLLGTGFLGTPYLLGVLADTGHSDVAYRLLLNTEYPSWGYMVSNGATTMWERWNGDKMRGDPSMNSYNHYAYGAVADWIYRYAAGVDALPTDAGFHTLLLHPDFDPRLGSIDFSYVSPYGEIKSKWSTSGSQVKWSVTVPPNTTAQLPLSASEESSFTLDGVTLDKNQKVSPEKGEGTSRIYKLSAGTYEFSVTNTTSH